MTGRIFQTLTIIIALFMAMPIAAQSSKSQSSPFQQAALKVLREMPVKMYEGTATDADLQSCLKLYEIAPSENAKRPFLLLGAQYQRLILQKPEKTLEIVAPVLVGKDKAQTWRKENETAVKAALLQWNKDREAAKKNRSDPPPPVVSQPSVYLVELPKLTEWKIDAQTAPFAVEAAHCLAMLDKPQKALEIIDAIGQRFTDETRVLAAECGADLFVRMKMYERSLGFYGFALNVLDTLKQREYDPGKGELVFFSEEQKIIHRRLAEKRQLAQNLYDEERFGPDWVAYRDAQHHHHGGRYLDAYFAYIELMREFSDTIYCEAANCYLIEILCKLADKENVKEQAGIFKERQKELAETKRTLAFNEKFKSPETVLENYRSKADRLERSLKTWQKIPIGRPALEAAEREVQKFVERDKYGLYRGEAMLNVGLCWLETFLEPEKAEPWLSKANDWFDEVKKLDMALLKLEVPDKSFHVSKAPPTERFTDEWTNVKLSKPKPGDLFNRRECSWYLSAKHKDTVLWLGLIAYAKKNYDIAEAWWKRLYAIDQYLGEQDQSPFGSTPGRLLWNIKNNLGGMYATKEEMEEFTDTQTRLRVLLADVELENTNLSAAEGKFRSLLKDPRIQANLNQNAYCNFALAVSLMSQFKKDEANKLLEKFIPNQQLMNTKSAPRALLYYANNIQPRKDQKLKKTQMRCYEHIVKQHAKAPEAEIALFYLIDIQQSLGLQKESKVLMEFYIKKHPKGDYIDTVKEWLSSIR